ncbi:SH3 domain-containing protein [Neoasaia chiangmaiensis]|uniref:SH3 domain-containing protein n=2 Tax=Neoasaia chiangmaiensis TaxID=320497 RepID=UPI000989EE14|nr:SH3 domain-containing protein [Neoasaia chiangmaiensis]
MKNNRCGLGLWLAVLSPLCVSAAVAQTAPHHHKHHHIAAHDGATAHAQTGARKTHGAHAVPHGANPQAAETHAAHRHGRHHEATVASRTPAHHAPHRAKSHAVAAGAAAGAAAGVATGAAGSAPGEVPAGPPPAPDAPPQDKGTNTGLPLPRFAAMRADKVYLRKGPGQRYPIEWVYHRRGLPVEVEREFDVWRLIEDSDGTKGWVHQATLVGQRTFVIPGLPPEGHPLAAGEASEKSGDVIGRADARVVGHVATEQEARAQHGDVMLYSQSDEGSSVVAVLQPGTVGNIKTCPQGSGWCRVVVKGYSGWLPKRLFWGLLPGEVIQPS